MLESLGKEEVSGTCMVADARVLHEGELMWRRFSRSTRLSTACSRTHPIPKYRSKID